MSGEGVVQLHEARLVELWDAEAERDRYRSALEQITTMQPRAINWLRANGIKFIGPLGTDPANWENVAFSIYNDLCEVDVIARNALKEGVQV